MQNRRRLSQTSSLLDRLLDDNRHLRELAEKLPSGPALDDVLRRIRQNETAARISAWLDSPGLRAPR
jgi:hypothetical protein